MNKLQRKHPQLPVAATDDGAVLWIELLHTGQHVLLDSSHLLPRDPRLELGHVSAELREGKSGLEEHHQSLPLLPPRRVQSDGEGAGAETRGVRSRYSW